MSLAQIALLCLVIIAIAYLILKFGKALAAVIAIVAILLIGWVALVFGFHAFSGKALVATIHASPVANASHEMIVDMTTYDASGNASHETYEIGGDRVQLQCQTIELQPWALLTGAKSAYQLSRISGQYDAPQEGSVPIQLGSWSFFTTIENNVGLLSPVVKSAYSSAVIVPIGTHSIFVDQFGDLSSN